MIAYNRTWLDALLTTDLAKQWHEKGLISDERLGSVQERYRTGFYSPNVFVRIGLGIFGLILIGAVLGLIILMVSPDSEEATALFGIFCGAGFIVVLETVLIRNHHHYGSGLDDVLLYAGTMCFLSGLCTLLPDNAGALTYSCVSLPFLVIGAIRYLDRLMTAAAFICALLIVLLTLKETLDISAVYIMPFIAMLFSAGVYYFAGKGMRQTGRHYWEACFGVLAFLSLLTFYAGGNYWVVQQAGWDLLALEQPAMPWLFWALTFAIPVFYIFRGLRGKDRLLLDVGIGCAVAAVFTFRFYFHVFSLAWVATIGGAVLFVISYLSIRYLRSRPDLPYTYETDGKRSLLQKAQEQIFDQTISGQATPAPAAKTDMGGGQFGGGGAGSEF